VVRIVAEVIDAVFARLEAGPPLTAPASYELRDGQVYRWSVG
jgi:hypothetical protein